MQRTKPLFVINSTQLEHFILTHDHKMFASLTLVWIFRIHRKWLQCNNNKMNMRHIHKQHELYLEPDNQYDQVYSTI